MVYDRVIEAINLHLEGKEIRLRINILDNDPQEAFKAVDYLIERASDVNTLYECSDKLKTLLYKLVRILNNKALGDNSKHSSVIKANKLRELLDSLSKFDVHLSKDGTHLIIKDVFKDMDESKSHPYDLIALNNLYKDLYYKDMPLDISFPSRVGEIKAIVTKGKPFDTPDLERTSHWRRLMEKFHAYPSCTRELIAIDAIAGDVRPFNMYFNLMDKPEWDGRGNLIKSTASAKHTEPTKPTESTEKTISTNIWE